MGNYDFDEPDDDRYFGYAEFLDYHRKNPAIYRLMLQFTNEIRSLLETERGSIWLVANRVRWEVYVTTSDPEFKIPNGALAYYARLLMARNSRLEGFFQTKRLKYGEPTWDSIDLS